jgi:hypothetical protein
MRIDYKVQGISVVLLELMPLVLYEHMHMLLWPDLAVPRAVVTSKPDQRPSEAELLAIQSGPWQLCGHPGCARHGGAHVAAEVLKGALGVQLALA